MITQVTFYKSNLNLKNRAYSSSYLSKVEKQKINVQGVVYPNIPFILPTNIANTVISNGYDYISYDYNGKTYYSFLVDYEPITPTQQLSNGTTAYGTFKFIHKLDTWLTFKDYISMTGIVKRAHVNDYNIFNNEDIRPNLKYTDRTPEVQLLPDDLITYQRELVDNENIPYIFLYVLTNHGAKNHNQGIHILDSSVLAMGLEVGLFVVDRNTGLLYSVVNGGKTYDNSQMHINNISSSNIVCMLFSELNPNTNNISIDTDNLKITVNDAIVQSINEDNNAPFISYLGSLNFYDTINISELVPNVYYDLKPTNYENVFSSVENFKLNGIMKMHTSAYLPFGIGIGEINYYDTTNISLLCDIILDPYLTYYSLSLRNTLERYRARHNVSLTNSQFIAFSQNDYWTKLNANANIANAEFNNTKSKLSVASTSIGLGESIVDEAVAWFNPFDAGLSGKTFIDKGLKLGESIVNLQQSEYNLGVTKELNTRVLNEGVKNLNTPSCGSIFIGGDAPTIVYHTYYSADKQMRIAELLYKYGYSTYIDLETYFNKHLRTCFNFVKCQEVVISGVPLNYCQEIEDMFLKGVTLWQSEAMNYDVINRQVNEELDV